VLSPVFFNYELKSSDIVNAPEITFGDKVRVVATASTENRGVAGQTGIVYGFTTPSQTGVEVVGDSTDDYAIAVMIEGRSNAMWFAANLLEFLDHQPGTTVEIGSKRLIRDDAGRWHEVKLS
jgi:hypothetical protein